MTTDYRFIELDTAIRKGIVGPFEFSIIEWIAKLRYVTNTMLLDLIQSGYVSFSRYNITRDKLNDILNRMRKYRLITSTRFIMLNDDGISINEDAKSILKINTLGQFGDTLLHELGKKSNRHSIFDIYMDGNTVKGYLTSNQWLIYWLKTYNREIGEKYETNCTVYLKGAEFTGARLYATITVNNHPIVAEPVRRVADFEAENSHRFIAEKLSRMSLMFDYPDQLYLGRDKFILSQRPVITLLCEDDEHMTEIWEAIKPVLPEISKDQEIWFTTDLRIYNYDMRGQRFWRFEDDKPVKVDLTEAIGMDKELDDDAHNASES